MKQASTWTFFLVTFFGISGLGATDQLDPRGMFTRYSVGLIEIPEAITSSLYTERLKSEGRRFRGVAVDLNGDGIVDYFVRMIDPDCGNGGCGYAVIDGSRKREIGQIFGSSVIVLENKINGFPIIQSASSFGANSAEYVSHVYDGKEYRIVSRYFDGKEGPYGIYPQYKDIPLFPGESVKQ